MNRCRTDGEGMNFCPMQLFLQLIEWLERALKRFFQKDDVEEIVLTLF